MIQNTEEWKKWRHAGIGASESPIIMGVSRFKTKKELWAEKINPTPPKNEENFIHKKGHELERIARNNYQLQTFDDWAPKLAVHSENEKIRASLDGWNNRRQAIWECKYVGLEKYEKLKNTKLTPRERIPEDYWPQLMHQVLVTGAREIHFTAIVDDKVLKTLKPGETEQYNFFFPVTDAHKEYIEKELLPEILKFIHCVETKTEPALSSDDEVLIKDSELSKLLTKYKKTKNKLSELEKEEKALKEEIFSITLKTHNRVLCNGCKITETISADKEAPDFEAYVKAYGLEDAVINNGFIKKTKGRKTRKISEVKK